MINKKIILIGINIIVAISIIGLIYRVSATNVKAAGNSNCLTMNVSFNASNWPGGSLDISCKGDTGRSGCVGDRGNISPGETVTLNNCTCYPTGQGCLQVSGSLPPTCTSSSTSGACGTNRQTINPTINVTCDLPPTPTPIPTLVPTDTPTPSSCDSQCGTCGRRIGGVCSTDFTCCRTGWTACQPDGKQACYTSFGPGSGSNPCNDGETQSCAQDPQPTPPNITPEPTSGGCPGTYIDSMSASCGSDGTITAQANFYPNFFYSWWVTDPSNANQNVCELDTFKGGNSATRWNGAACGTMNIADATQPFGTNTNTNFSQAVPNTSGGLNTFTTNQAVRGRYVLTLTERWTDRGSGNSNSKTCRYGNIACEGKAVGAWNNVNYDAYFGDSSCEASNMASGFYVVPSSVDYSCDANKNITVRWGMRQSSSLQNVNYDWTDVEVLYTEADSSHINHRARVSFDRNTDIAGANKSGANDIRGSRIAPGTTRTFTSFINTQLKTFKGVPGRSYTVHLDSNNGTGACTARDTRTVTCPVNNNPTGNFDQKYCVDRDGLPGNEYIRLRGWACDKEVQPNPVQIEIYADAPKGQAGSRFIGRTTASGQRRNDPDYVNPYVGSSDPNYNVTLSGQQSNSKIEDNLSNSDCGGQSAVGWTFEDQQALRTLNDGLNHRLYAYAINQGLGTDTPLTYFYNSGTDSRGRTIPTPWYASTREYIYNSTQDNCAAPAPPTPTPTPTPIAQCSLSAGASNCTTASGTVTGYNAGGYDQTDWSIDGVSRGTVGGTTNTFPNLIPGTIHYISAVYKSSSGARSPVACGTSKFTLPYCNNLTCSVSAVADSFDTITSFVTATGDTSGYDRVEWFLTPPGDSQGSTSNSSRVFSGLNPNTPYTIGARYYSSTNVVPSVTCTSKTISTQNKVSLSGKVYIDTSYDSTVPNNVGGNLGADLSYDNSSGPITITLLQQDPYGVYNQYATTTTSNAGDYSFTNLSGGYDYRIQIGTVPPDYQKTLPAATNYIDLPGVNTTRNNLNFGITPLFTLHAKIIVDANNNGVQDPGETVYTVPPQIAPFSGQLQATRTIQPTTSFAPAFANVAASNNTATSTDPRWTSIYGGTYSVRMSNAGLFNNYKFVSNVDTRFNTPTLFNANANPFNINVVFDPANPSSRDYTVKFFITPYYSITGKLLDDTLRDFTCSEGTGKSGVTAKASDTITGVQAGPTGVTAADGSYTLNKLLYGSNTVTFSLTYPYRIVKITDVTTPTPANLAKLQTGNIVFDVPPNRTVNVCASDRRQWFGTTTGDVRIGSTTTVDFQIPKILNTPLVASTGNYTGPNAYLNQFPSLFIGSKSSMNFAPGFPSISGASYFVLNSEYGLTPGSGNAKSQTRDGRVSYSYFKGLAARRGFTILELNSVLQGNSCDDYSDCKIKESKQLDGGIYQVTGDLTLTEYSHKPRTRVVILVSGNLTIKDKIIVDPGNILIIAVQGNITIDPSVGDDYGAAGYDKNGHIEGIYSAEGSFTAAGGGCSGVGSTGATADKRLNIYGAVIVNARRPFDVGRAGTFRNLRSLCLRDADTPSVKIFTRPDFILNMDQGFEEKAGFWKELNP